MLFQQSSAPDIEEDTTQAAELNEESEGKMSEDGYEIMNRISPRDDSPKANIMAVKENSSSPCGGEVNLILSFGNTRDNQVQVLDLPAATDDIQREASEAVHRVRITQLNTHHPTPVKTVDLLKQKRKSLMFSGWGDHFSATTLHGISLFHCNAVHSSLAFTTFYFPSFCPSLSPLCLNLLPVKSYGGTANGFWEILSVV